MSQFAEPVIPDESAFGIPREAKLERIFFPQTRTREFNQKDERARSGIAPPHLFLSPLWDSQGMEFVLEFFSQIAAQVLCQKLSFRPEKSTLALVKKISKW